jgi:hypothetical protein
LTWFRKEPDLQWFDGAGESPAIIAAVTAWLDRLQRPPGPVSAESRSTVA